MEWLTLVSALAGTFVGVASTLLTDGVRARRERADRVDEIRRETYVKFLTAMTETDAALQDLVLNRPTPVDRPEAVAAFKSQQLLACRYELELVASPEVNDAAQEAYICLRRMSSAVASTTLTIGEPGSPEWEEVHLPYVQAIRRAREAMRSAVPAPRRVQP